MNSLDGRDFKSRIVLMSFINYCASHPEERFWQALRNWARVPAIIAVLNENFANDELEFGQVDTYNWEGHRR